MRVLHITNSLKGGAGSAAYRLHEALLNYGIDSTIITQDLNIETYTKKFLELSNPKNKAPKFWAKLKLLFYHPIYSVKRKIHYKQFIKASIQARYDYMSLPYGKTNFVQLADLNKYDIIHLHWVSHILDYTFFFRQCKKPIVWTLHDVNPLNGLYHYDDDEINNNEVTGRLSNEIKSLKRKVIFENKFLKYFVGPSGWITNYALKAVKSFSQMKAIEIPNPICLSTFHSINKVEARLKLGLDLNKKIILFNAHDLKNLRKGFDLLLEALKYLDASQVEAIAIGNTLNSESSLKIHFTGLIDDNELLANYYSAADAVIIPSREDNLPNVMLEAFACGCPVIGFSIGGLQQHIINNVTGKLAIKLTAESLAEAITNFFSNQNKFQEVIIREYAKQNFSPQIIAEHYFKLYQTIFRSK